MRLYFLVIFFLSVVGVKAQDSLNFISATTGAASQEVCYFDNHLFVGAGSTFMVFDVSSGETPPFEKLFEYRFNSTITDITVKNGFLYIAANHDGISKWDISIPSTLQKISEYIPNNPDDAAYDISFYGDSIIVAYKNSIAIFDDNINGINLITTFAPTPWGGIIRGGAVKDSIYIFAEGMNLANNGDGIYFYNLNNLSQLAFYHQTFSDPEDVLIGNNNTVHILGGGQSTTNPLNGNGYFYSLDISDINNPYIIYSDTIQGNSLSIADAMNASIYNDTIYIATMGGIDPSDPNHANIYVYDATNTSNIHLIKYLNAGNWHFDVDFNPLNRNLYIASEWYGIKTLDLTDFDNYSDIGNTLTGGWNTGSDAKDSLLIVANEGYGFKKYNITDVYNPYVSGINNDNGFCNYIKILENGNIVGFYTSGDGIRVFNPTTLTQVASIPDKYFYKNIKKSGNRIIAVINESFTDKLISINFNDPQNPYIENTIDIDGYNDMDVNQSEIFIAYDNIVKIYNLNNLQELTYTSVGNASTSCGPITVSDDTTWVYCSNIGLVELILSNTGGTYLLSIADTFNLPQTIIPNFIANDNYGIYAVYKTKGLYAFDKTNMQETGYYKTGLDYWKGKFGVQDLFCNNNYIFLVEYHSQTSILTNNNNLSPVYNINGEIKKINIYPNPANQFVTIKFDNPKHTKYNLNIYNYLGKKIKTITDISSDKIILNLENFSNGIYLIKLENNQEIIATKKLIINK